VTATADVATSPLKLAYRPDIDGMRAIAVIAVILFHASPQICPGGFIGVDIFFVLSGYLITSIILVDLSREEFSFSRFYARRIRKIFPALSMVLAFCLVVGWFILFPHEWKALAKNVLAGAGFYSNFLAARTNGYFDDAAKKQPLLHLWSLGIEEQFYIFWPLTLVLLWKRPRWVLPGILLLAGCSFALNIAYLKRDPVQSFYNPAMRIWELLVGAALAWFTMRYGEVRGRSKKELLSAAGLALIAAGFCLIDQSKPFPGWWGLVPVAGTVMLVRAGSEAWFNRWALASRPAVFVGLISYSFYLWHWPLLVFARLIDGSDYHVYLNPYRISEVLAAVVVLAFILSWATYKFWETPMRFSVKLTSAYRVAILLASMSAVVWLGVLSLHFLVPRLNSPAARELAEVMDDQRHAENWGMAPFTAYVIPSGGKNATLFVGDSNMAQYESRIEAVIRADPHSATAVFATSGGCPPLPGMNQAQPGYRCPAFYDYWTAIAMQPRFSTVVISALWWGYDLDTIRRLNSPVTETYQGRSPTAHDFDEAWRGLETNIRSLVKARKRVVILASIPTSPTFDSQYALSRIHRPGVWRIPPVPRALIEEWQADVNARLKVIARDSGAEIVWPMDYLCPGNECPGLDTDGSPIYSDGNHLRSSKAANLATFVDDLVHPSTQ